MTDPQDRKRIAAWIAAMKGDRTGEAFAADVTATTGWKVDRSRLSKYATGSIHIGRDVIAHMSDYAARKGFAPVDLNPPSALSLEERAVIAAERQADAAERQADLAPAILALTAEMAKWRDERVAMQRRIVALEARLGLDADVDPELAAWGQAHAGSRSQRPAGHPAR